MGHPPVKCRQHYRTSQPQRHSSWRSRPGLSVEPALGGILWPGDLPIRRDDAAHLTNLGTDPFPHSLLRKLQ